MAEQNPRIVATDDPVLAENLGLTKWDEGRGQYVAPDGSETEFAGVELGEEAEPGGEEAEAGDEVAGDGSGEDEESDLNTLDDDYR